METVEEELERLKAERDLLVRQAELEAQKKELIEGLPHLYGEKFYVFMRKIWDSTAFKDVISGPNQVGKSTILVRRSVHRITNERNWEKLWPKRPQPRTFWYLYPNKTTATSEFYDKWVTEILPRNNYIKDPFFGWEEERKQGDIHAIHWKIGVTQYFKTYAQNVSDLQSGTVWEIDCDEEPPFDLMPELLSRLTATDGYFAAAFTATRAQRFWKRVVEGQGTERAWPEANRQQVSLYDCQTYEDGSPSPWTLERIKRREAELGTKNQIDKRIHGKFVKDEGLLVETFDETRHYVDGHPVNGWLVYSAVDIGSGTGAHPAAIVFLYVKPDFTEGRVFQVWRGDNIQTASTDIMKKYREMRGRMKPVLERYDWESKEFGLLAQSLGEPFTKANKDREAGYALLNSLFKNDMLKIYKHEQGDKLIDELNSVSVDAKKQTAADDLIDALRYAVMDVPWDFSHLNAKVVLEPMKPYDPRANRYKKPDDEPEFDMMQAAIDEANQVLDDYDLDLE